MKTQMNLTVHQKEYLIQFFENEKYPGWKNIATSLIEKGTCIVAGNECIWKGGVGNFIKTEKPEDYFDSLLYKFDLMSFLNSRWIKDELTQYQFILFNEKKLIDEKYNDICDLSNLIYESENKI